MSRNSLTGMGMKLEKLLEPGRIGNMEVPNRLVFAPVATSGAGPEGVLTPHLRKFYEERIKGGPGLIIMGHTFCWREEATGGAMGLWDDSHIPPLAELVRFAHQRNVRMAVQLGGRGTRRPDGKSMAPSVMRFAFEEGLPREITVEELAFFVEHYGDAARRAREAGFDAVELHAAHGKLVSMFLSSYSNRRDDAYGGTLEKRTLFARQIVAAIKEKAGADFPVIFRYSADDMVEGGNTLEEGVKIARIMNEAGVDAFEVSAGNQECGWNTGFSYFFPRMCLSHLPGPVRVATGKPVIAVGKIGDPFMAEHLLREGKADFIALARPFITDPQLLVKAREGRGSEIRRCLYCLNCYTYQNRGDKIPAQGLTCTVNPMAMHEDELGELKPAEQPRNIVVIGGGLAGMEAARTLARRGQRVTLYEAQSELGGQWLVASHASYKSDFRSLVPWLMREMQDAGVTIKTGIKITPDLLRAMNERNEFDAVILATGARPREICVDKPVTGAPDVVQAMDVIMGKAAVGDNVVVVGGRYIGMEVADQLAVEGKKVSLVEAQELGHGAIPRLVGIYRNHLVEHDVHIFPRSPLMRLAKGGVDIANNGSMLRLPCDTVVLAIGTTPVNELGNFLEKMGVEWRAIGDCREIGDALYAIREGALIGREL